jgi:hypothetical protein
MARNIAGLWKIIQTNDAEVVVFVTMEANDFLNVDAIQTGPGVHGRGRGHKDDVFVSFTIDWDNQTRGAYNGAFDAQGRINGSTFDVAHPDSFAGWHSDRTF